MKDKFTNHIDVLGRVTLYPKQHSNPIKKIWDSENQLLWTGEAIALLYLTGNSSNFIQYGKVLDLHSHPDHPGLYSRQPGSYLSNNTISKDEYLGILLMCLYNNDVSTPRIILKAAHDRNWCLLDTKPTLNPLKSFLKRPIYYIGKLLRKESDDVIYGLTQLRQPSDRLFYKIAARETPSLLDYLWFFIAAIIGSYKPKSDTSSKIMTFFKFQILRKFSSKYKLLEKLTHSFFTRQLKRQYGNLYLVELFKIYYLDDSHPFHELARMFHEISKR